ncbi:MAG: CoA transferase [Acidimicrobiia bacterium]|nr:CoA transferase [Acidimicrobiia bacterium]
MTGPMQGVRVVELGVWVAGPAAGGILADWGADVVKVEPATGDPARTFQRMLGGDMATNPPFELDNRAKRSVVIDLTTDDGLALFDELLSGADVFVTNLRLGALERLGLDYEQVAAHHPTLIYGHITGYGREGPDADRAAYDIAAFWARSGIAAMLTPPGANPPFQRGGMGDHSTGLASAGAISAALFDRTRTGEGQLVSTSLLRQGMYTIGFDININLLWGLTLAVGQRESMGNPAVNNYVAGDGRRFWIVGLEGERHWPPLARAVGHPEWLTDERFSTPAARHQHGTELITLLDEIFATRPLDEWAEVFATEADLFWAPVNGIDDLLVDEQVLAAGALVEVPDGDSTTTMVATPVDFGGTPCEIASTAPALGEHTDAVLAELGRSGDDIAALRASGIVA